MYAYKDAKCVYGYMTICAKCLPNAPRWVDASKPLKDPPNVGTLQRCEMCKEKHILSNKMD